MQWCLFCIFYLYNLWNEVRGDASGSGVDSVCWCVEKAMGVSVAGRKCVIIHSFWNIGATYLLQDKKGEAGDYVGACCQYYDRDLTVCISMWQNGSG